MNEDVLCKCNYYFNNNDNSFSRSDSTSDDLASFGKSSQQNKSQMFEKVLWMFYWNWLRLISLQITTKMLIKLENSCTFLVSCTTEISFYSSIKSLMGKKCNGIRAKISSEKSRWMEWCCRWHRYRYVFVCACASMFRKALWWLEHARIFDLVQLQKQQSNWELCQL